jgi:GT2 family glycosyltransferase
MDESVPLDSTLDIVIVNWNTREALADCVVSIGAAADGVSISRVVIVDNASSDDSLDLAVNAAQIPLTVERNASNAGFAAACNQGAAGSTADYLLFLNPDTRLERDTLARTLAYLDQPENRDVGICGIRLLDDEGRLTTSAARFPTPRVIVGQATGLSRVLPAVFPPHLLTPADCPDTRDVDQVIGAYFVIRRPLFEQLGGFDERFFVYFEEVDLSLRARLAGYRSVYYAGATAHHTGGLSSAQVKAARLFYSLRGRLLYAWKHYSFPERWFVAAVTFGIEGPARMLAALLKGGSAPAETLLGYRRLFAFVGTPGWSRDRTLQRQP